MNNNNEYKTINSIFVNSAKVYTFTFFKYKLLHILRSWGACRFVFDSSRKSQSTARLAITHPSPFTLSESMA